MKLLPRFKWIKGRQESGYDKMLVANSMWPIPFDIYILRFPTGSFIKDHVDEVSHGDHHRINIILKPAASGGDFICGNSIINWSRVKYFRPDKEVHGVSKITKGTRYVLSIGFILNR